MQPFHGNMKSPSPEPQVVPRVAGSAWSSKMQHIILQHKIALLPLKNKTRDNGILMELGCLSEHVSGPSISCTAHTLVMDAQRRLTRGSYPFVIFFKIHISLHRLHFLYEFMVLSYIIHGCVNLQGYKNKL